MSAAEATPVAPAAPAAAPVATETPAAETPVTPEAPAAPSAPETPLTKLTARLPEITKAADYAEMWGVDLVPGADHVPSQVVLQKFLRANNSDVAAAEKQLTSALQWRKKVQPAALVSQTFDSKKFGDLGFVTVHKDEAGKETIVTWNIYGAVKDNKTTFGDVEEFIKWRAALMELSVQKLNLNSITETIPEDGADPYQMVQVHDYKSVSFFRMDPHVKAASKETIQTFSMAYPELLAHKYFVNVPAIMGWMYGAMKLFLAPATLKKFHPMTSGTTLATELTGIVSTLPKDYGGQGPPVTEGFTIKLAEATKKEELPETSGEAPVAAAETKPVEDTKPTEDVKPAETTTEAPVEEKAATEEVKPAVTAEPEKTA